MTTPSQLAAFNYATPPFANWPIKQLTDTYTLLASDNGYILNCTSGTFTINLRTPAVFPAGFCCWVWNTSNTATDVITLQGSPTQTIDGSSSLAIRKSSGTQIIFDGVRWQVGARTTMRGYSENINNNSAYAVASATGAMALGQGATASSSYATAISFESTASANNSFAAGVNSGAGGAKAVTGSGAMALGGSYASGTDSFAAAISNNTSTYGATAANSIAMGYRASASGAGAINFGYNATCSGSYSRNFGYESTSTGSYSIIINGTQASDNGIWGKCVIGAAFVGGGQKAFVQLRALTTDATATVLASNGAAVGAANQVILPNNSAFAFVGTVVARQQASGGTASAAWKIEGLIRREGTAASTTLVASTVTAISNVPGWTLALSADTTNGGLAVTATGAASTNIKWLAVVESSEITYA